MNQALLPFLLFTVAYLVSTHSDAAAVTDGSMGAVTTLTGQFEVTQNLGTRVGDNLFHSFSSFSLNSNEAATFTGDNSIQNVISRVTGGQVSQINGLLRSLVGQADFYFINPAGVVFGQNAQIDVPAAFRVSTADELRFKDGGLLSASQPNQSSLSASVPEAYGFLTDRSSEIAFLGTGHIGEDGESWQGSQFRFQPHSTVELVANTIHISGSQLISENGVLRLIAQQGIGSIPLNALFDKATGGVITINDSWLDVSGNGGGFSALRGGDVSLKNSYWYADNSGNTHAALGAGIDLHANSLNIDNGRLTADVNADGNAGNVDVVVDKAMAVVNGSQIHSSVQSGAGNAGSVSITAEQLTLDGQGVGTTSINSNSQADSGNAGVVSLNIAGELEILNAGYVGSATWSNGNANTVSINANDLVIDGQGSALFTGVSSSTVTGSTGNAGQIDIIVNGASTVRNGGVIVTSTSGQGDAGIVNLSSKQLTIDGLGRGNVIFTGISSGTEKDSTGNGNQVNILTDELNLLGGSKIQSTTRGAGNGGVVSVQTSRLIIDGGNGHQNGRFVSGITATAFETSSSGQVGDIQIQADNIQLFDEGRISTRNLATVSEESLSKIKPAQITISTSVLSMDSQSQITTQSSGNIAASNILVNSLNWLDIHNSLITTSVSGTNGNGGNITINSPVSILETGFVQANTTAKGGQGGLINVNTKALVSSGNSLSLGSNTALLFQPNSFGYNVIQAAAPEGLSGAVNVTSPQLNLSGVLVLLKPADFKQDRLLDDFCAVGKESSLTKVGRGGLLQATDVLGF